MMLFAAALPLFAMLQAQPQRVDVRALARSAPDSVLTDRARRQPDMIRSAIVELRNAGVGLDSTDRAALTAAERLAVAYAVAWSDSFHVRQIGRFRSLGLSDRRATLTADSVTVAGQSAFFQSGAEAGMRIHRENLPRYEALHDTTGMAVTLRRLGLGFIFLEQLDSAETYLQRAFDLGQRVGNQLLAGNALGNLGIVSGKRGDLSRAKELYARARPFRERTGDQGGMAADLNNLGNAARDVMDLLAAREAFQEAYAIMSACCEEEEAAMALSNVGRLDLDEGDYAAAAARFAEALAIFRKHGNRLEEASLLQDQGTVAVLRGDYRAAVTAYSSAAAILRRTGPGQSTSELDVRVQLSLARASMGDLQGARRELARAETLATRVDTSGYRAGLSLGRVALARADLAVGFNQLAEAEQQYTRAQRLALRPNELDAEVRQLAQFGEARLHYRRGSYARARTTLERLLSDTLLHHQLAAQTRILIGDAVWRQGDTAAARRIVTQALDSVRAVGNAAGEAEALGRLGGFEMAAGRPTAAEALYQRGVARLKARPVPEISSALHAGLARALRSRGELAEAARELETGIAQIERISSGLSAEQHRAAFLANKWDVYVDLASIELARGRMEESFEASERLRARQMLDLLARGRVATGQAAGDRAIREQDLRRRIGQLTEQVERPEGGVQQLRGSPGSVDVDRMLRETLDSAQQAYGALLVEMREANPAYAALISGELVDARAVRTALAPDEALLEYLVGDSTTFAYIVTADTLVALDLKVNHASLLELIDFARIALASPREGTARRAWRAPMRQLYGRLVAPVEATGLLAGKRRLIVAPHAELHYLPFAALVRTGTSERLLIEQYVLEYIPSASVWLRLRDRPQPAQRRGLLALAPRATALPASRSEVTAIKAIFGDSVTTLVGSAASERVFRDIAPRQRVIHLATHGVFNKHNPLFSYLALEAGGGDDGRLEVHEVFGLSLGAQLVVLSACQTGVGAGALADVPPGDDWLGLVQAFLFAGAGNVLGTLWAVQDVATARLMERFYREIAEGGSAAEALARAQRAALRVPATAHPFFWSGFTLVRGG